MGEFLVKLLGSLIKTGLPLFNNVKTTVAEIFLTPLGYTIEVTANGGIHRKIIGSGMTLLIIYNEEMKNIM